MSPITFQPTHRSRRSRPSGFTLVEMMLAVIIASMVLAALWVSLGQLTRGRTLSRERLAAHIRADLALNTIRREIASILRSDDLFWTQVRIYDGIGQGPSGLVDRDDLLLFSNRLQRSHPQDDQAEGIEYETQYRIEDDPSGTVLWQRRDAVVDEYFDGGGVVTPIIDAITGFNVEAYDGVEWFSSWESDDQGIPLALRLTIEVPITGKATERPVILRTLVAIDRVPPPFDAEEEEEELTDGEEVGQDEGATGGGAGGAAPGGAPTTVTIPGGGRGGGGTGGPPGRDGGFERDGGGRGGPAGSGGGRGSGGPTGGGGGGDRGSGAGATNN